MTKRKPMFQQTVIDDHYKFLDNLREQGKLGLSGGFTDKTGGAYIIEAENLEEAKSIAFSDPIHITNSSEVTVYEWNAK
ncbi:MAG: YciI family protein [Pyrinomonadaceae bacterium]|nr:YciI family protein [Pyrinomonadaceae bacterium]